MQKSVLIVDDIAFVRKTLRAIFVAAHIQVIGEAADGQEACELFYELKPDFVTMDIVMPQMSGIEATRRMIKMDKHAKVIIISAMGHDSLIMEAIHVGAKDYLMKPFKPTDVLRAVDRLFQPPSSASRQAVNFERDPFS